MDFHIDIRIHSDYVTIQEDNVVPVTRRISNDSYESIIFDIGEALMDYLEGLG